MKPAVIVLSALMCVALAGCKPQAAMTAGAIQATPAEPGETPAPVMSDADAASFMAMQSPANVGSPAGETPATEAGCADTAGQSAAQKLVDRCIAVSPATHPPCNVANTCKVIQDEIDRSCAMYGAGEKKPAECTA